MSPTRWLLLVMTIAVSLLLWAGLRSPSHSPAVNAPGCPLPPLVSPGDVPLQSDIPAGMPAFAHPAATLTPLAGFSVDARVLSRTDYRFDKESKVSPTDLALAWGRMRDDAVLEQLQIGQGQRFYYYRWRGEPPLPPVELTASSANMHMIPANDAIAQALKQVSADQNIRIHGWLVEAATADGNWRWRSSLTRQDTGAGACELVYVCAVEIR